MAFPAHTESCWVRQEGRGRTQALKFLMRSMVFSLLMLYTSRLRAGWSYQHTTLRKQTSWHPWHHRTVMGHHSRHVAFFFQSLFVWQHEGLLHSSTSCVYIKLSPFFSSLDCFKHWIKAGNYCQGKWSCIFPHCCKSPANARVEDAMETSNWVNSHISLCYKNISGDGLGNRQLNE